MKKTIYLLLFAVLGLSASAQQIISITYAGGTATLTRSTPPAGVTYYWQGSSCGTVMSSSALTYSVTQSDTYFLRAFSSSTSSSSSSSSWAPFCASTIVLIPDETAPVLSAVTAGPIEPGTNVSATSNEDGMVYLVPEGTTATPAGIAGAAVDESTSTAGVAVSLSTTGIALGNYVVYALDASNNVSSPSAVIEVTDLTAPVLSDVTTGTIDIGANIAATSNEDGMIYLVPEGTASNYSAITGAAVGDVAATAGAAQFIPTTGLTAGNYVVYAVDGVHNISTASATITLQEVIDGISARIGSDVAIFPPNVEDVLNIRSEVAVNSARIFSMSGTLIMEVDNPGSLLNLSSLDRGMYIVQLKMADNSMFAGKIIKK